MATSSFTHRADAVSGFPFDAHLDVPTRETIEAMLEAERTAKDSKIEALDVENAIEELKR